MRLFVKNIPWQVSERELGDVFADFGCSDVVICKESEKDGNRSRGCGFLTCERGPDAIAALDSSEPQGRKIRVEKAKAAARAQRGDGRGLG